MENYNHHWHWWHWLVIVIVIVIALGISYTLITNYEITKKNNESVVNKTEQVIDHPIDTTKEAANDITNK